MKTYGFILPIIALSLGYIAHITTNLRTSNKYNLDILSIQYQFNLKKNHKI